jgi:LysM repeat protein
MTKETKVGLLVGMTVIILICIVVSDYLSQGRQPAEADLINGIPAEAGHRDASPLAGRDRPLPIGGDQGDGSRASPAPNFSGGQTTRDEQWLRRVEPSPRVDVFHNTTDPDVRSDGGEQAAPMIGDDPAATGGQRRPRLLARHHVQANESLWAIAQHYYGDGNLHAVIYQANRNKMRSADDVREGVMLEIPRLEDIGAGEQAAAATTAGDSAGDGTTAPAGTGDDGAAGSTPRPMRTTDYRIQSGDTLGELAQKFYGTSRAMDKLIELNRDRISDPDNIRVGQVIRVPVRQ